MTAKIVCEFVVSAINCFLLVSFNTIDKHRKTYIRPRSFVNHQLGNVNIIFCGYVVLYLMPIAFFFFVHNSKTRAGGWTRGSKTRAVATRGVCERIRNLETASKHRLANVIYPYACRGVESTLVTLYDIAVVLVFTGYTVVRKSIPKRVCVLCVRSVLLLKYRNKLFTA